ncbi:MAG: molybdate ABC transporter permease subunit [Anaerovoracaceae bacterium]
MWTPILLSVKVAIVATFIAFITGTLIAYFLTKRSVPFKNFFETLIILPLILPPSVTGYILLYLFGKRGPLGMLLLENFHLQVVFTWGACVIASSVVALPLMYQNAKAAFLSVDPSYEKAARTLGSGEVKIFFTVLLPLSYPGIISGIALTFARALGEFGATLMVAGNIPNKTQTIPTAIYYAVQSGNSPLAQQLVLLMTVFSFLLIFLMNMYLKKKDFRL